MRNADFINLLSRKDIWEIIDTLDLKDIYIETYRKDGIWNYAVTAFGKMRVSNIHNPALKHLEQAQKYGLLCFLEMCEDEDPRLRDKILRKYRPDDFNDDPKFMTDGEIATEEV